MQAWRRKSPSLETRSGLLPSSCPSGEPLAALAETISAAVCHRTPLPAGWEDDLAENPERFARHLTQALGPDVRLLLVVDQLEDALRAPALTAASKSPEQDTASTRFPSRKVSLALSRCGSVWVVATLRADQVAALVRKSEPFWKLINRNGYTYDMFCRRISPKLSGGP